MSGSDWRGPGEDAAGPPARRWTRRAALVAFALVWAAFFAPVLVRGHVLAATDLREDLGGPPAERADPWPSNRKHADQTRLYLPELRHHLSGDRSGWLALWNPHVQLGRPSHHVSGLSRAYPITFLLSLASDDPFVVYTALTLVTVLLAGVFFLLFLDALGLHPAAALAGALALALGPFVAYWLTFVMFVSTLCWSACLAWLSTRWMRSPRAAHGLGIAAATWLLLLSGYPQMVVHQAWALGAWCAFLGARAYRDARRAGATRGAALAPPARRLAGLAALGTLGAAAAAPVLVDLARAAARSARLEAPTELFLSGHGAPHGAGELLDWLARLADPTWLGNPMDPARGVAFEGFSWTPLFLGLALAGLALSTARRAAVWWGVAAAALALALSPAAYAFAVQHLGFGLSRASPLALAALALPLLAAVAADAALRRRRRAPAAALALSLAPVALALAGHAGDERLQPAAVALSCALGGVGLGFLIAPRPLVLALAAAAAVLLQAAPLVLHRPPDSIVRDSPLVRAVRAGTTSPGERPARFAFIGYVPSYLLIADVEGLVDLRSVHSYDSLSSRAYQRWAARVDPRGTVFHGRWFTRFEDASRLSPDALAAAGVDLLLSRRPLDPRLAERVGGDRSLGLWRPRRKPLLAAQLPLATRGDEVALDEPLHALDPAPVETRAASDDRERLGVRALPAESLLFLSRQHHPYWTARDASGRPLEVVRVDDFFLGVRLPPGTSEVELAFRPWARWAWVPMVAFAAAALGLGALRLRRRTGLDAPPADDSLAPLRP